MNVSRAKAIIILMSLLCAQAAVYFWAHWCHPCKQLDEVFAELAKDSSQAAFIRVRIPAI